MLNRNNKISTKCMDDDYECEKMFLYKNFDFEIVHVNADCKIRNWLWTKNARHSYLSWNMITLLLFSWLHVPNLTQIDLKIFSLWRKREKLPEYESLSSKNCSAVQLTSDTGLSTPTRPLQPKWAKGWVGEIQTAHLAHWPTHPFKLHWAQG